MFSYGIALYCQMWISPKRRYESTEARSDSWTGFSFDIWHRRITFYVEPNLRVNVKSRLIKLVLLPLWRGDSYTFGREEEYPCRIFFPSCCIQWIHISGFEEWEIVWHRRRQLAGLRRLLRILLYLLAVVFSNQWAYRQNCETPITYWSIDYYMDLIYFSICSLP